MEGKKCQNNVRANSSIQNLPEELKTKIFSQLPMKDIFSVCLVCKQWNYIVMNNESVWKLRCNNLPEILHMNIVNDKTHGHNWKETFKMNYGKNGIKRMWQQGLFSNPASYDDLPQGMFSNLDVDSWGDLFQQELDRS